MDGSQARPVYEAAGGSLAGWLPNGRLLVSERLPAPDTGQALKALTLSADSAGQPLQIELARGERLRGTSVSPDGRWLAYLVTLSADPEQNGIWLVNTQSGEKRRLEFFGAYRWRDGNRLLVVPIELGQTAHRIWQVDVESDQAIALTDPAAVAGFVHPSCGDIRVGGQSVVALPPHRRNLGVVFQDYALFPHMSVEQNVGYGLRARGRARESIDRAVAATLRLVRLEGMGRRYPGEVSGGQRQRVALARALVIEPDILLLDEPLAALDRKLRDQMQVELKRIQRETRNTTIIVTHDQEEALSLADRVPVMFDGRIVEMGAPEELYGRPASVGVMAFLGEANLFTGRVRDVDASNSTIACDDGFLLMIEGAAPAAGSTVTVVIHPEHVPVVENGGGENTVEGVVSERVYKGAILDLHVSVAGRDCTVALPSALAPVRRVPEIGAPVNLSLPRARLVVLA